MAKSKFSAKKMNGLLVERLKGSPQEKYVLDNMDDKEDFPTEEELEQILVDETTIEEKSEESKEESSEVDPSKMDKKALIEYMISKGFKEEDLKRKSKGKLLKMLEV